MGLATPVALADAGGDQEPEEEGAELTRGPSTNTLRSRRLEALAGGSPTPSPTSSPAPAGGCVIEFPSPEVAAEEPEPAGAVEPEPEPEQEPADAGAQDEEEEEAGAELTRGPSNNTLRNLRLARLGGS